MTITSDEFANRILSASREQLIEEVLRLRGELERPLPMLLTCPMCSQRHIDDPPFDTKPHHTHACQHCGMVWRPAKVCTIGVRFLPGYKNG